MAAHPVGGRVDRALMAFACVTPLAVFFGVYGPSVGRGFISDDFGWIADSRVSSLGQALALFGRNHGFYRPLVSASFALNYALFGMRAAGYGYTNLALAIVCAALLFQFCRGLGLGSGAAGIAVAIWVLNFHGISMALLWISGRTALLLVASSLAAAIGVLRRSITVALAFFALALLSKEEAVLLPVVLLSIAAIGRPPGRTPARDRGFMFLLAAGLLVELAVYLLLRAHSGAMTPATAPDYYRFTFAPRAVLRNIGEYADRACSLAAGAALVGWAILRSRREDRCPSPRPAIVLIGCLWLLVGYAITVFLPVRSDLYACLPSVGAVLLSAEFLATRWQSADAAHRRAALALLIALPLGFMPVYIARNDRWTGLAGFSTRVLNQLAPRLATANGHVRVVLVDDEAGARVNVRSAFGSLIVDALRLTTKKDVSVWVEPAWTNGTLPGLTPPCAECPRRVFLIRNGAVVSD